MKTILKILLLSSLFGMLSMSCGKESNSAVKSHSFGVINFKNSSCKSSHKTILANNQAGDSETMQIKSENGNWNVKHINAMFNCDPGKLTATGDTSGFTININENEEKHDENCLCLYDLSYKVGPIAHGKYTVILNKMGSEYFRFSIDYTSSVDTTIFIKKTIL